ncbi:hypothetical protein [Pseudomonas sp. UMAB-40]|uniref:hypothetical protein n=1 Tax=Pseudomonas sp. UMAB-40 TaxID=1365407 RepID=UPI001C584A1E|nr:hypothetical protein [Pseudomonas sp. UMAB-40]
MLAILSHIVLFLTAAIAGKVCASKGFRQLGICAFVTLELGYLTFYFGSWWMGLILMLVGLMIVLRCERKASANRTDLKNTR